MVDVQVGYRYRVPRDVMRLWLPAISGLDDAQIQALAGGAHFLIEEVFDDGHLAGTFALPSAPKAVMGRLEVASTAVSDLCGKDADGFELRPCRKCTHFSGVQLVSGRKRSGYSCTGQCDTPSSKELAAQLRARDAAYDARHARPLPPHPSRRGDIWAQQRAGRPPMTMEDFRYFDLNPLDVSNPQDAAFDRLVQRFCTESGIPYRPNSWVHACCRSYGFPPGWGDAAGTSGPDLPKGEESHRLEGEDYAP